MPIYEYKCSGCGHTMEKLQKFSDDPLTECPVCHNQTLEKQIGTGTGILFSGYGWTKPGLSVSSKR